MSERKIVDYKIVLDKTLRSLEINVRTQICMYKWIPTGGISTESSSLGTFFGQAMVKYED